MFFIILYLIDLNFMKNIVLSVEDKEFPFFMNLIKKFDFVHVKDTEIRNSKQAFLDGLKEAVDEVNLAKQGKIKLKSAEELLHEL